MRINVIKVSSLLMTVVIVTLMTGLHYLKQQAEKPLTLDEPLLLTVKKGQFSNSILKKLKEQSLIEDTFGLKVMLKMIDQLDDYDKHLDDDWPDKFKEEFRK